MAFFQELKRRNVFRVGIAYAVTAWLLLQVADIVFEGIEAPQWVMKALMFILALGFPLVLAFSWVYEITPEGIKREREVDRTQTITPVTARRLDFIIIGLLVLALGAFTWDRFYYTPDRGSVPISHSLALPSNSDHGKLEPTQTRAAGSTGTSIAVLPFVNLSADPEQEYFSDGISEELLNVLAKYPDLRVAARTSSFQFKGENKDISKIARQLNVNHVLEGSVRKSGAKLRITAQLIDAESGFHLWSGTYDRELDDIFVIQDEISAAIGDALQAELALSGNQPGAAPRVAHSDNTAAYEAFLQGRHLINQRGARNVRTGVEHLERCVRLDPDFAPGHAWLAIGYVLLLASPGTYGDLTLSEVQKRAVPHIETALELDRNLAEAYGAKGLLGVNSNQYAEAMEFTARALELNPVYVDALNWRQIAAAGLGEYTESNRNIERILEIDPLSVIGRLNYATSKSVSDPERARDAAASLTESFPWAGSTSMGYVSLFPSGDLSGSLEWYLKAYRIEPRDQFSNNFIMSILASTGEFEEARRITNRGTFLVDVEEGRFDEAIEKLQGDLHADPENSTTMTHLADALHLARRFDEAQPLYAQLARESPSGLVFSVPEPSTVSQVRMAYGLRRSGDASGARAALDGHHRDFGKREEAGVLEAFTYMAEAMAQALEDNKAAVFDAIRRALSLGMRQRSLFKDPVFDALAEHPEMLALKAELNAMLDIEHQKILQLICHDNPADDTWQPRRETCENVPEPQ